jgi:hypothetical protein
VLVARGEPEAPDIEVKGRVAEERPVDPLE